jgi:hypothetical protein
MGEAHQHFAPWTENVVRALNNHQGNALSGHPYTCPADGSGGSVKHSDRRILVANELGWFCPFLRCGYHQKWAYVGHVVASTPLDADRVARVTPSDREALNDG